MPNNVTAVPAADPAIAREIFGARLTVETDADDVAAALAGGDPGFLVLDARSAESFAAGHLPGAVRLDWPFDPEEVAALEDGLIVVYCWGPGCNGATKAAGALAGLGRHVKEMLGGFEYWVREGHPVEGTDAEALLAAADVQGLTKLPHAASCLC